MPALIKTSKLIFKLAVTFLMLWTTANFSGYLLIKSVIKRGYVESFLVKKFSLDSTEEYEFVSNVKIHWNPFSLGLNIRDVNFHNKGRLKLLVEKIILKFNVFSLMSGNFIPNQILIENMYLTCNTKSNNDVVLFTQLDALKKLKNVKLFNASIHCNDEKFKIREMILSSDSRMTLIMQTDKLDNVDLNTKIYFNDDRISFDDAEIKIVFGNSFLKENFPLMRTAEISSSVKGFCGLNKECEINVFGLTGKILDKNIEHQITKGRANVNLNLDNISISGLFFLFDFEKLIGDFDIRKNKITGYFQADELDLNVIPLFWKAGLLRESKNWYENNVKEGSAKNIKGAFELFFDESHHIEIDSSDLSIIAGLENVELPLSCCKKYISKIDKMDGRISINLKQLSAEAYQVRLNENDDLYAQNAKILIDFKNGKLFIRGKSSAKIRNLIDVYNKDLRINVLGDDVIKNIAGNADGDFDFNIDLLSKHENIAYNLLIKSSNLITNLENNNLKLENGNIILNIDEEKTLFDLRSLINRAEVRIGGNVNYTSQNSYVVDINEIDYETIDNILKGALREIVQIKGGISGKIIINDSHLIFDMDLKNAQLVAPYIKLDKPIGESARLRFKMFHNDDVMIIDNLVLTNEDHEVLIRHLEYFFKTSRLLMNSLILNQNNSIKSIEMNKYYNVRDVKIDASRIIYDDFNWLGFTTEKDKKGSGRIVINGKVNDLEFEKAGKFQNLVINISCDNQECQKILVKTDNKSRVKNYIDASIIEDKIFMETNNAGILLRGAHITEYIENGGRLNLNGYFSKYNGVTAIQATAIIKNFNINGAPIITKILSLASFTGLLSIFSGQGIHFSSFITNFVFFGNHVTFGKSIAEGEGMGIIFEGDLNLGSKMKLQGSLTPINILNIILRRVPILGRVLVGTKGNGIFTANFELEGDIDKPNVKINPINFLTPYAIKKVFDR